MRGAVAAAVLALCPLLPAQAQTIVAAEYVEPTDAYPHGVLGDDQEWGAVQITVKRQRGEPGSLISGYVDLTYQIDALPDTVFEDLEPRLWDVTGDGAPEVVVVESHQSYGARLMVIGLQDGTPRAIAATPYIGTRFRWLAPVGAADLDGDGHVEIAFIDRPHLAQVLRIWRFREGALTEVAVIPGFTNHRIGENFISGGLRECGDGPELIVVRGDWSRITAIGFNGRWVKRHIGPYTGPDSLDAAMACQS